MKSYSQWLYSHGARINSRFRGWQWQVSDVKQRETMAGIRAQIFPARGVRVRCEDIPGFPEQVISADLIDLDEQATQAIKQLYEELEEDGKLEITKILKVRQEIEVLKISSAVEILRDRIAGGFSVCLFVNFQRTVDEAVKILGCDAIDGRTDSIRRQKILDCFQANESRSLVLNSDAAGLSINLQDLDGEHPRFGIVSPPWSAVTFRQLTGRFRRQGGRSKSFFKVLFAAGTVEMRMWRALRGKLDCLDSLNDNDLQPGNLHLTGG